MLPDVEGIFFNFREDIRTANIIAYDEEGVDCLILERA